MEAYEFQTAVNDGIINIPIEYKTKISNWVRVILISENPAEQSKVHAVKTNSSFHAMKLDTSDFVFDREEANER